MKASFSVLDLELLFVSILGLRLAALFMTLYALTTSHFLELNPVTSPVFSLFGALSGTAIYTLGILFMMGLVMRAAKKVPAKLYPVIFAFYFAILVISTLDFANDALLLI